jgi:hypothetical protein
MKDQKQSKEEKRGERIKLSKKFPEQELKPMAFVVEDNHGEKVC